ncbi:MAG: hypothetical protein ACRD5H_10185 [Nitrososphaerales archaeon]
MTKEAIKSFLRPRRLTIALLATFILVAIIFQLRSPIGNALGIEKDSLFFWYFGLTWYFPNMPLLLLSWAMTHQFFNTPLLEIFTPMGAGAAAIYYFLLSCFISYVFRSIKWNNESWRRAQGIKS